jgi:hypothetical protein
MRLSFIGLALAVILTLPLLLSAQAVFPRMVSVEPTTTKAGGEVTVQGENLDKANVAEVYLTDGQNDTKVEVLEQTSTNIKIRVPASMKPGRFGLVVLTTSKPQRLIEQPVKLTISE